MVRNVFTPEVQLIAYVLSSIAKRFGVVYILSSRFDCLHPSECESDRLISDCTTSSHWFRSTYWLWGALMAALWLSSPSCTYWPWLVGSCSHWNDSCGSGLSLRYWHSAFTVHSITSALPSSSRRIQYYHT